MGDQQHNPSQRESVVKVPAVCIRVSVALLGERQEVSYESCSGIRMSSVV